MQEFVEGSPRVDNDDESKVVEDAGKEDMFVDCPDELVGNADGKETVVLAEMGEDSEEKLNLDKANGDQDGFSATAGDEVERLRAKLDKVSREYKVNWIGFIFVKGTGFDAKFMFLVLNVGVL